MKSNLKFFFRLIINLYLLTFSNIQKVNLSHGFITSVPSLCFGCPKSSLISWTDSTRFAFSDVKKLSQKSSTLSSATQHVLSNSQPTHLVLLLVPSYNRSVMAFVSRSNFFQNHLIPLKRTISIVRTTSLIREPSVIHTQSTAFSWLLH